MEDSEFELIQRRDLNPSSASSFGGGAASQSNSLSNVAGFWRRFAAYIIDSFIIGIVGSLIGIFFASFFCYLHPWGRVVGFSIALAYFATFSSEIGGGQTFGKRALKIRIVDKNLKPIGLARAISRYVILLVPIFVNGAVFKWAGANPSSLNFLWAIIFFGWGSIVYFLLFNLRTRQSVHDLLTGTYVIDLQKEAPFPARPIWRGHYAIFSAVAFCYLIASFGLASFVKKAVPFSDLLSTYSRLNESDDFVVRQLTFGKLFSKGGPKDYVQIDVILLKRPASSDAVANRIVKAVLADLPRAKEMDFIAISVSHGFDLGIARGFWSIHRRHSPGEWIAGVDDLAFAQTKSGMSAFLRSILGLGAPIEELRLEKQRTS